MRDKARDKTVFSIIYSVVALFSALRLHDSGSLGFNLLRGTTLSAFGLGVSATAAIFYATSAYKSRKENSHN